MLRARERISQAASRGERCDVLHVVCRMVLIFPTQPIISRCSQGICSKLSKSTTTMVEQRQSNVSLQWRPLPLFHQPHTLHPVTVVGMTSAIQCNTCHVVRQYRKTLVVESPHIYNVTKYTNAARAPYCEKQLPA